MQKLLLIYSQIIIYYKQISQAKIICLDTLRVINFFHIIVL